MRKLLSVLLAVLLLSVWMVPAQAAETVIKMADVAVQESDTVYVAVSLESEQNVTAMAVAYTYDSALLRVIPEECRWVPEGTLSDFSKTANQAVWVSDGAKKLSGDLCVLAFRILNPQSFKKATVTCHVTLEDGSASDTHQVASEITKTCAHSFGEWTPIGDPGHIRTCDICGDEEFQSHNWDQGTTSTDPQKPNTTFLTYTCSECSHKKVEEIPDSSEPSEPDSSKPTDPDEDDPEPTKPKPTYPDEEEKEPTSPTKPSTGGNSGSSGNSGSNGNSSNSTNSQKNPSQPQNYNQGQSTAETKPTTSQDVSSTVNSNIHSDDTAPSVEVTHPMAIKVDETEADNTDYSAQREVAKQASKKFGVWFASITAFLIGAAYSIWTLVLKKKK